MPDWEKVARKKAEKIIKGGTYATLMSQSDEKPIQELMEETKNHKEAPMVTEDPVEPVKPSKPSKPKKEKKTTKSPSRPKIDWKSKYEFETEKVKALKEDQSDIMKSYDDHISTLKQVMVNSINEIAELKGTIHELNDNSSKFSVEEIADLTQVLNSIHVNRNIAQKQTLEQFCGSCSVVAVRKWILDLVLKRGK